jgi:hypothetical protein
VNHISWDKKGNVVKVSWDFLHSVVSVALSKVDDSATLQGRILEGKSSNLELEGRFLSQELRGKNFLVRS